MSYCHEDSLPTHVISTGLEEWWMNSKFTAQGIGLVQRMGFRSLSLKKRFRLSILWRDLAGVGHFVFSLGRGWLASSEAWLKNEAKHDTKTNSQPLQAVRHSCWDYL